MARSSVSLTFALATATVILLGGGATPGYAQSATPAAPSAAPSQRQYAEVEEAVNKLRQGDMPGAIKTLEEAAKKYPDLPSAHVLMYRILASPQVNQPNFARLQLDEAIKADPSDPEPYMILGDLALQDRRTTEAKMDFDKAKQLLAGYANARRKGAMEHHTLSGIAQAMEIREDWKEVETPIRELLVSTPEDLIAYQRLARALFQQGKARESYEVLKKAKEIDRANAKKNGTREVFLTPEAILAQYYDQYEGPTSKTGNAEKWFKIALAQAPGDLHTRQVVALWALRSGKLDFAKEQADAAVKIEASDPKYSRSSVPRELRGLIALWEKKWENAAEYFESVRLEAPNDFVAKNNCALALVEQSDPDKQRRALAYAEANYKDNKNSPDALSTLGWVYFKRGAFDQAEVCLDQARRASGDPDTLTYWAHILNHYQRDWAAKVLLEDILKNDQPFSMRPEALDLYKKVKDAKNPQAIPAAKTP